MTRATVNPTFTEERMDAQVWIEIVLIVLRLVAAGLAG